MAKKIRNYPTKAIVGFVELSGRQEALTVARDSAKHFFVSCEDAHVYVVPYGDGYIYEAHEAGGGRGHLLSALKLLQQGKEQVWFRIYQRVVSLEIVDKRPVSLVLSRQQALEIMQNHPDCEAKPADVMLAVNPKGERTMAAGVTLAACGLLSLCSALVYDATSRIDRYPTSIAEVSELPFRQWGLVENTPIGLFVETLKYDAAAPIDRRWVVARRPVDRGVAPQPVVPAAALDANEPIHAVPLVGEATEAVVIEPQPAVSADTLPEATP